jgi:hypothetical protein
VARSALEGYLSFQLFDVRHELDDIAEGFDAANGTPRDHDALANGTFTTFVTLKADLFQPIYRFMCFIERKGVDWGVVTARMITEDENAWHERVRKILGYGFKGIHDSRYQRAIREIYNATENETELEYRESISICCWGLVSLVSGSGHTPIASHGMCL